MSERDRKERALHPAYGGRRGRCSSCWLALLLIVGVSRPALADASTALDLARSVAVAGREAFTAGDYEKALELFRRAFSIYPAPTLSLYEARSLAKLGRLREADEALQRTLSLPLDRAAPAQFGEAMETARQERDVLAARIPSLTVRVLGVGVGEHGLLLSMNHEPLDAKLIGRSFPLDPGVYLLEASTRDGQGDKVKIELTEGRHFDAVLNLGEPAAVGVHAAQPEAPARGRGWQATLAYSSLGLGVAGLATGVITGFMAGSKHSEAIEQCPAERCLPGSKGAEALDSFRSLRTVSTVAYGVGAAGVTAGLILWFSLPDTNEVQVGTVRPWLTQRFAGVQGVFR